MWLEEYVCLERMYEEWCNVRRTGWKYDVGKDGKDNERMNKRRFKE